MHHLRYVLLAWAAVASVIQGAPPIVIPDSVDLTTPSIFSTGDIQLTVYQEPSLSDPTSVFFDYSIDFPTPSYELTFDNVSVNLDEGSDWWIVREGSVVGPGGASFPFDPPSIDGVTFESGLTLPFDSPLITVTSPGILFGPSPSLFLGFSTVESGGFLPRTIFGWVELELPSPNESFTIPRIVGSATAFNSGGIIVGSLITVPEPNSAVLFFTGVIASAWLRRRG